MPYIHPLIEGLTLLLALYVLGLGVTRFAANHMHATTAFAWKRHATLGQITLVLMLAGIGSGMLTTWLLFNGPFVTGLHWKSAFTLAPFILLSYATGLTMHLKKKKRSALPLLHALLGVTVIALAILQAATGMMMLLPR